MNVISRKFVCKNCGRKTYEIYDKCLDCKVENSIEPIISESYVCYLNGNFYGTGNMEYMLELFKDYVVSNRMYNKYECEFRIVKVLDGKFKETLLKRNS